MGLRHWDPWCDCAHINNANSIWTSSALHTWFLIIPDTLNFFRKCFPGEKGKEKETWRYISNISFMNKRLGGPCFSLTQNPPGYACCPCTMAVPIFSIRVPFLSPSLQRCRLIFLISDYTLARKHSASWDFLHARPLATNRLVSECSSYFCLFYPNLNKKLPAATHLPLEISVLLIF